MILQVRRKPAGLTEAGASLGVKTVGGYGDVGKKCVEVRFGFAPLLVPRTDVQVHRPAPRSGRLFGFELVLNKREY